MTVKRRIASAFAALGMVVAASAAQATILTIYDDVAGGASSFASTVTGAGGTVTTDVWTTLSSGLSIDRGDYVITNNDGGFVSSTTYGTLSGRVVGINPAYNSGVPAAPSGTRYSADQYFDSGITFTFDSAINSIGFEVGDWATCCHNPVTELFISFDGGTPIKVASADDNTDGQFPSQTTGNSVYEIFVAAFDDSGSFTTVSFWGNGIGEYLVAGGSVHYALLATNSLPPVPSVPLPAGGLLLLSGAGALGLMRRRGRKAAA